MKELRLKFKDENGATKNVLVAGEKFVVGRTPDNDLSIPIANLSRKHLQIDRFGDVFIVSDCNSSNGTKLNGKPLTEPSELKAGDKLNLGEGVEIEAEFFSDAASDNAEITTASVNSTNAAADSNSRLSSSSPPENSFSFGMILLAPVLGIFVLAFIAGILYITNDSAEIVEANKNDRYFPPKNSEKNEEETIENDDKTADTPTPKPAVSPVSVSDSSALPKPSAEETPEPLSTQKPAGDADKIDRSSIAFLRRIAANDANAFLTGKQISTVAPAVNQLKTSSALADNLKTAKREASQIETLARSKNLRPQFLTAAAIARLGSRSGSVLQTAQSMLETLSTLRTNIGNELADDNLLIIAAYEQGEAGKTLAMRDTVANLTNKFPAVSSRTVRTIWFLRDNGKLSDSEFDFAIKFLAVGIIMQNPKDFNVQAEAVNFN